MPEFESDSEIILGDRCTKVRLLGKSTYSRTYLYSNSQQPPNSLYYVIKQILIPDHSQEIVKQLFVQAKYWQKYHYDPQIPKLIEFRLIEHLNQVTEFWLIQDYIAGENLEIILKRSQVLNESQVRDILKSLLLALELIHGIHQIIHGDIKPTNIIQDSDGRWILVGCSLAQPLIKMGDRYLGNAEYAAPEQTQGQINYTSDLYSLGLVCLHLLTGISPFQLYDRDRKCWVWREYLTSQPSDRLAYVLDKLVQREISQRFQSAAEALLALGEEPLKILLPRSSESISWQCDLTIVESSNSAKSVNAIAIDHNQKFFASSGDNPIIKLWSLGTEELTNQPLKEFLGHTESVRSLAIHSKQQLLASSSDDRTIKLWSLDFTFDHLQPLATLCSHTQSVKSLAFSPDGKVLASGSADKTVKLWDIPTSLEICSIPAHRLQITAVTFSPDGEFLATAGCDRLVRLWKLDELAQGKLPILQQVFSGHNWAVLAIAFSPNGNLLASGSDDRTIRIWDVRSGVLVRTITGHSWSVSALAFSSDGEILFSASWDKTVKLWEVSTGKEVAKLSGHTNSVNAIAITSNDKKIISASKDGTIKLWLPKS